jgi:translation initiation factor IF-2
MIAVNKVDLPDANVDRIKQQLTQHTIVVEEFGGTTVVSEVSAKTGKGIDHLLEMINIQAELLELRAPRTGRARGVVLEARKSAQHGVVVNVLVRSGTLRVGDVFVAGRFAGRVRALLNERGRRIEEVTPGAPVSSGMRRHAASRRSAHGRRGRPRHAISPPAASSTSVPARSQGRNSRHAGRVVQADPAGELRGSS